MESLVATDGAYNLIYSIDRKSFIADTNQKTHEAIRNRFKTQCLPNWVVNGNLALSKRALFADSVERNNTTQIFHRTQLFR